MPTLLARNAAVLVTMDDGRRELTDAGLFARDGKVVAERGQVVTVDMAPVIQVHNRLARQFAETA